MDGRTDGRVREGKGKGREGSGQTDWRRNVHWTFECLRRIKSHRNQRRHRELPPVRLCVCVCVFVESLANRCHWSTLLPVLPSFGVCSRFLSHICARLESYWSAMSNERCAVLHLSAQNLRCWSGLRSQLTGSLMSSSKSATTDRWWFNYNYEIMNFVEREKSGVWFRLSNLPSVSCRGSSCDELVTTALCIAMTRWVESDCDSWHCRVLLMAHSRKPVLRRVFSYELLRHPKLAFKIASVLRVWRLRDPLTYLLGKKTNTVTFLMHARRTQLKAHCWLSEPQLSPECIMQPTCPRHSYVNSYFATCY